MQRTLAIAITLFALLTGMRSAYAQGTSTEEFPISAPGNVTAMRSMVEALDLPVGIEGNAGLWINRVQNGVETRIFGVVPIELLSSVLSGAVAQDLELTDFDNVWHDPEVGMTGRRTSVVTLLVQSSDMSEVTFVTGIAIEDARDSNLPATEPDHWFMLPTGCHVSLSDALDYGYELQASLVSAIDRNREPVCSTELPPGATCTQKCNNEHSVASCRLSEDFYRQIKREFRNTAIRYGSCLTTALISIWNPPASAAIALTCVLGNAVWNMINIIDLNHDFDRNRERLEEDRLRCIAGC